MSSIPVKNVYHMLVYVFDILKQKEYERLGREQFEDVYNLLASLLLCGTGALLKRGLLKNYVQQCEEVSTLKGRIDWASSVRRLSLQRGKAVCCFDDFSSDILFNQVLKSTFLYLRRKSLQPSIKKDIGRMLLHFEEINTVSLTEIAWDKLVFHRNNAHYDTLIYFCRLICEDAIANQQCGKKNFRTIEEALLPKLFERFVFAFYRKHLSLAKVTYQHQVKWATASRDTTMLPKMSVDTVIELECNKLIIDTKFYAKTLQSNRFSDNQTVISSNLYQIFAYVQNEQLIYPHQTVSGLLLYPQIDISVDLMYEIGSNRFFIKTINLNQEFMCIRKDLLSIFDGITPSNDTMR